MNSGKDYAGSPPNIPAPGSDAFVPTPEAQPAPPIDYPQFLPGTPGPAATGLTPAHFAAINNMNGPSAAPPASSGPTPAAAGNAAGQGVIPAAVQQLPPAAKQAYLAAVAAGDQATANRILLTAAMNQPQHEAFMGQGNRSDWGGSSGPGHASHGGHLF